MKTPLANKIGALTLGLFAASCMLAAAADADDQASSASALISQVAKTLQSANSIKADFDETDSYPVTYKDLAQRGTVELARPGELRVDIKRFRRVSSADPWGPSGNDAQSTSDGKTYWYAFQHPHSTQVRHEPVSDKALNSALEAASPLRGFFASTSEGVLPGLSGVATLLPSATWEGQQYQVLQYAVASERAPITARAYVGADLLIHRIVYRTETRKGTATKEWTLHNIVLNSTIDAATFAYTPPADATPLPRGGSRGELLETGTVAPDFSVHDATGKLVKLSDYRGKTVVLDFWATWCWPCNQSLPHTEKVVADKKDVVTLAVAIRDSQAGFDAWIAKHNYPDILFARDNNPQGKDVASTLYNVTTTPTAYVIDADGKIVKSISGYAGPTDELESAIQEARQPKTANAK